MPRSSKSNKAPKKTTTKAQKNAKQPLQNQQDNSQLDPSTSDTTPAAIADDIPLIYPDDDTLYASDNSMEVIAPLQPRIVSDNALKVALEAGEGQTNAGDEMESTDEVGQVVETGKKGKKRGPYKKNGIVSVCRSSSSLIPPLLADATATSDALHPAKISYQIAVFSHAEMKKAQSRQKPVSTSLELQSDLPWINFQDQLLIQIIDLLQLSDLLPNIHDFKIECLVPWQITMFLQLCAEKDYKFMIDKALIAKTNKSAKIQIEETAMVCI